MTPVLRHEFVEFIPKELQDHTIYVSITYATAAHKCVCGCGRHVVTPITPTDWHLTYDGDTISLYPSIGNWNFPCRSHYFIRQNKVQWARKWSADQIDANRAEDRRVKEQYYETAPNNAAKTNKKPHGLWGKLRKRFSK